MCFSVLSSPFFGSQAAQAFLPSYLRAGRRIDILEPGKPLPGAADLSIQPRSRLPGAVDSDKSFIPCYAFPYGTGTYEASFIPGRPCSPFPVPKNYSLGRNLVVVAVTRKQTKGLILLRPCLRQDREYGRAMKWEDDNVCCRATMLILR